jgi:hypothetical protein
MAGGQPVAFPPFPAHPTGMFAAYIGLGTSPLWSLAILLLLTGSGMIGYAVWILYKAYGRA